MRRAASLALQPSLPSGSSRPPVSTPPSAHLPEGLVDVGLLLHALLRAGVCAVQPGRQLPDGLLQPHDLPQILLVLLRERELLLLKVPAPRDDAGGENLRRRPWREESVRGQAPDLDVGEHPEERLLL